MAKWQTCAYGQINSAVCVWSQRFIWLQHDDNDSKVKWCLFGTNSIQWTTLAFLYSVVLFLKRRLKDELSWYLDCCIDILTLSRNRHLQLCTVLMVNSWYNRQIWCMDAQFEHDTCRPFSYCFCQLVSTSRATILVSHFNLALKRNLKITYFGAECCGWIGQLRCSNTPACLSPPKSALFSLTQVIIQGTQFLELSSEAG